jgi:thioredoxin 1
MSDIIFTITDASFEADVLSNDKPVLVDYWAPWCGPCKAIGPAIEALSQEYGGRFGFAKCNVDENPLTAQTFGIKSIPTLQFFKDGRVVDQITGMVSRSKITETIEAILAGKSPTQPFVMQ